jgi:hypothetical protein
MRLTYLILLGSLALGCTVSPTKIGHACTKDGDCNVTGQKCVASICTHPCTGIANQCPIGYDCNVADGQTVLTCNKARYAVDATTGAPTLYGVSCSTDASVCGNSGDPAAVNPACRKAEDPTKKGMPVSADPDAYCTGGCTTDLDCPYFMQCAVDYDMVMKCLIRGQCSPCTYGDQCNKGDLTSMDHGCVLTKDGKSSYCTKTCATQSDCPGSAQGINYTQCTATNDAQGNGGSWCLHKYGACVGVGNICDPCRTKADCALTNTSCIPNDQTGESFCSKRCTADTDCNAGPNTATCDNTSTSMSLGICTGDNSMHLNAGLFTCWPL